MDRNRLREIRFFKRINQYQLALQTGLTQSRISIIENGYVTPKDDETGRLARALGVSIDELFPTGAHDE